MPKYETNDVIILLPGITGSVLSRNGKEVWGTSAGSIMRALLSGGDSIQDLRLEGDDPTRDDLGDGVTAPRLVQDLTIIPGFWKIDGYTKVSRTLQEAFSLKLDENFFEFPYDWRRDNRVAARKLQRQAHDWLKVWREKSGNADAKLILIGHSMGGLVARHFLEVLGGWESTRALITFGTPYRGSLNALNFLVNGYKKGVGPLSLDLSPVLRSLTSVYQLLPIYECVDTGLGKLSRVAETPALPNVDNNYAAAALQFHREIEAKQADNAKLLTYQEKGYQIFPIVGVEQPTYQSARFAAGKVEILCSRRVENKDIDESGDGTVPRISATPIELSEAEREVFAVEMHGSLQNNDAMLAQVRGIVSAPRTDLRKVRVGGPITLTLWLDDVYAATEPVVITVRPSDERPQLQAKLVNAETDEEVQSARLHPQPGDTQVVEFDPLPQGFYRVTVSGDARVSPVIDVFVVTSAN